MAFSDDISTVVCEDDSQGQISTVAERMAYMNGMLTAQKSFFREQITELKSSVEQIPELKSSVRHLEEENRIVKAQMEQFAEQLKANIVQMKQLAHDKMELAEQLKANKILIDTLERDTKAQLKQLAEQLEANKMEGEKRALEPNAVHVLRTIDELRCMSNDYTSNVETAPCVWKSSATTISTGHRQKKVDVLACPSFKHCVVMWKIKILCEDGIRLGVISSLKTNYDMVLGTTSESWSYGGWGDIVHNNQMVGGWHVGYSTGSIITFQLDLTGAGALSASVDGKPMIPLFGAMKKTGRNETFVPAVYLYSVSSKIEFLGFV